MRSCSRQVLAVALLLAAAILPSVRADDPPKTSGSLSGTVVDKDGKRAPGATISVLVVFADHSRDPQQVKTGTTNDDGTFKIEGLDPVRYTLKYALGNMQAVTTNAVVQSGKDTPLGKITLRVVTPPPAHPRG